MSMSEVYERINKLEKELELPENFYFKISEDDDWSFIIKLHSLIEAAVTNCIVNALGDARLENLVVSLPLNNRRSGKMAFIIALDLLPKEGVELISKLSEIRNSLVHKIANVNFSLEDYVNNLDQNFLRQFTKIFGWGFSDKFIDDYSKSKGTGLSREDFVKAEPKINIWVVTIHYLDHLYLQKENAVLRQGRDEAIRQFYEIHSKLKEDN
jgi:hypothetical protein